MSPKTKRRLIIGCVGLVAFVGCLVGLRLYGQGRVNDAIVAKCERVGVQCLMDQVSLSLTGSVTVDRLRVMAGGQRPLLQAKRISGAISLVDAIGGAKRPKSVEIDGLEVDLRVDLNTPARVQNLIQSLRGVQSTTQSSGLTSGSLPSVTIRDASLKVSASGSLKKWLPKPISITSLQLAFDPTLAQADLSGEITGLGTSTLSAKISPRSEQAPAHISAKFSPALRHALPKLDSLPHVTLLLSGVGFDSQRGVQLEGLSAHLDDEPTVRVSSARLERQGDAYGLIASDIETKLSTAILQRLSGTPKQLAPPSAGLWRMKIKQASLIRGDSFVTKLAGVSAQSPDGSIQASLTSGQATWASLDLGWPKAVSLDHPSLSLPLKAEVLERYPKGRVLFAATQRLLGRANSQKPADKASPEPPSIAKKTKKRRRRRKRRSARKPFTSKAIDPLKRLVERFNQSPQGLDALAAKLQSVPCALSVKKGVVGLRDTAASEASVGVRIEGFELGRTTSDGSRSLSLRLSPFSATKAWGEIDATLQVAPGAQVSKLRLGLEDQGGFARALQRWFSWVHAQADAKIGLEVTYEGKSGQPKWRGKIHAHHVGVSWWRLSPNPVDDFTVDSRFELVSSRSPLQLDAKLTALRINDAQLQAGLRVAKLDSKPTVELTFQAPEQDCGKLASAISPALIPTIGIITAKGPMSIDLMLRIPLNNPYKGKLQATFNDERCQVEQLGEIDVGQLAKEFKRPVNESGTILKDQFIGPKSDSWVPLKDLPAWVPYTIMVTEDAAFFKHHGLRLRLTERAIKMCLDYGRFVYGGSTLTQQLVKNLYLTRDKYLGRKLEELLIVWRLERDLYAKHDFEGEDRQVAIKDRIIELYVNSIEFGPHTYGLERGAQL
ncbi:MAG TPA: hypothetical protein DCQ06_05295 [Myxococcales bacterium]|nr:hypothetical protein [Myxococcales bacterium]